MENTTGIMQWGRKYSYKLEKRNNKNVKSQLIVDLFVM